MINLYLVNDEILLYNVEDWFILRKEYRIIGEIIGNSLHVPSLPIKILPEEACLLVENNVAIVLKAPDVIDKTDEDLQMTIKYKNDLLDAQTKIYKESRKQHLEEVADKIVAIDNKRSKEEIVEEELKKCMPVTQENIIWPLHLSSNSTLYQKLKLVELKDIEKLTTPLKKAVYRDLWEKSYYITQGDKFGGHFLVYLGDPICFHAVFIVRCINKSERIFPLDLIAFGRLGTSVKKRSVWASIDDDKVSYITMSWIDA